MRARLHLVRTVTCPDCRGEGHLAASPSEWEAWFREYTAAQDKRQQVLQDYQAGTASLAELDAATLALTDVVTTPSGEVGGVAVNAAGIPMCVTEHGGVCETCNGHGVQLRQRRFVGGRAA